MADAAFDALISEVRKCTRCAEHLPLEPRPILQAHPDAQLLIAGQAPGRRTHQRGIPFDDVSGDRLREWLGISRAVFYDARRIAIVPMGFCYPGTGKSGDLPPRPECARTWHAQLLPSLVNIKLRIVIGQFAIAYHLPHRRESLTHVTQDWRTYWPDLIPLPHPSPRNNLWISRNPWFEAELLPALRARVAEVLELNDRPI